MSARPFFISLAIGALSRHQIFAKRSTRTGIGIGGSGGWTINWVKEITIPRTGYRLPFENVSRICEETAYWLEQEVARWSEDEARISQD
ncbi:alpha/beta-hydrolase [Penicillium subrubescens]|jgi:hypothetical protein|uniref:Uncharacterized protein n=1 Tax=Penicillium subrubescens TaxID=1316194 RepID=A0A1Q5UQL8_9EURO|nr:alpha/beta-hydrolase [Penicillium subrubescens]KAJ5891447.1 alpha/beta-hydrolase [Penicillium subrubescens]OKP14761.1 hypothetical protein PENSUB_5825 [Penicillium subrubescens]